MSLFHCKAYTRQSDGTYEEQVKEDVTASDPFFAASNFAALMGLHREDWGTQINGTKPMVLIVAKEIE